jgi:phosphonate transport system substrate-binding protein
MPALIMGAVAYDAKVVTIWDGFIEYFDKRDFAFDYVLYSNYERMVAALLAGNIDAAWNSPLAWLQTEAGAARIGRQANAIVMRDTDCDLTSLLITKTDSTIKSVADLKGKRIAVGASDSPQATLIPLGMLTESGLVIDEEMLLRFNLLVGKHGDHIGGEREAVKALMDGRADAACLIDSNHLAFTRDGLIAVGSTRVLAQTAPYDHCNMTVLDGVDPAHAAMVQRFTELLLNMSYDDPLVRPLLDLEGLKQWKPGRTSGYAALARACATFGTIQTWLATQPSARKT